MVVKNVLLHARVNVFHYRTSKYNNDCFAVFCLNLACLCHRGHETVKDEEVIKVYKDTHLSLDRLEADHKVCVCVRAVRYWYHKNLLVSFSVVK